jgi:soluble lytic murein transglycosylase-like protein
VLLAFPLVTAGCGPRQVWGLPVEQLSADLARAKYVALGAVDFTRSDPDEALSLAPGAPYYLSFVFDDMGKPAESLAMLELAWSRSPSPWKEEAGVLLARRYNAEKSWDKAAATARRLLDVSGSAKALVEQRARRALVEALYWTESDQAVLDEAARLTDPDPEVLLFGAVSSLRLGLAPAHELVMRLFLDVRTSALHGRFATFLAAQPSFQPLFSKTEQDIITARSDFLQGSWAAGLSLLEGALGAADAAALAHSALIMDMGSAYVSAGRFAAGGLFMEKLSTRLSGQPRIDALEQAGRLYRRARDYSRALPLLRTAAEQAATPEQADRARWLILDALTALSPPDLARRIGAEASQWQDPWYYADLLEEMVSAKVASGDWPGLADLRRALEDKGPDSVQAEIDYVLARAWQAGRIRILRDVTAGALLEDAARRDPDGYYGVLAASLLGRVPDRAIAGSEPPEPAPVAAGEGKDDPEGIDSLTLGFLAYGLSDEAFARLSTARSGLTDVQLVDAARRFAAAGDLRSSQYLIAAVARRRKLTTDELDLYYPRGYASLLEPLAASAGIPENVLYGLVREESFFDPNVVSSAGAVGLTQLMPVTAGDVARRLRLAEPDLRDPATNLALGTRHLRDLLGNVSNPVKALLAYNAGLSRLREWERAGANLPADLLVESVPIAETRGYIRKILVSSVMYAVLYGNADPREAALSFFGISRGPLVPGDRQKSGSPSGAS